VLARSFFRFSIQRSKMIVKMKAYFITGHCSGFPELESSAISDFRSNLVVSTQPCFSPIIFIRFHVRNKHSGKRSEAGKIHQRVSGRFDSASEAKKVFNSLLYFYDILLDGLPIYSFRKMSDHHHFRWKIISVYRWWLVSEGLNSGMQKKGSSCEGFAG
jgi:hypothetical protein